MVGFTLRFTPSKLYIYRKLVWTRKSFLYLWWPTLIKYSAVRSSRLENLTTPSLERFTLCKQELNCYIENAFKATLYVWPWLYDINYYSRLQAVLLLNCYSYVKRYSCARMFKIVRIYYLNCCVLDKVLFLTFFTVFIWRISWVWLSVLARSRGFLWSSSYRQTVFHTLIFHFPLLSLIYSDQ